jgi:CheY-like chemotaxis protein
MNGVPVTILLIEDDPGHARLIEKNVRRAGVNNDILPFTNGAGALSHLFGADARGRRIAAPPMLVLLDLNLPDMSGTEILARIKADEQLKRIPVIVLTTTDDRIEIERCYDLGCNVYITKPVDYDAFAIAIRQLGLFLAVMQVPDPT